MIKWLLAIITTKNKQKKHNNEEQKKIRKRQRGIVKTVLLSFICPIVVTFVGNILFLTYQKHENSKEETSKVPERLKNIEKSLDKLSSSVPEMVIAIEELQTIHANSGDVIRKDLSGVGSSAITLKAEGLLTENIRDQEVENLMDIYLSEPSWSPEEIIAIGSERKG